MLFLVGIKNMRATPGPGWRKTGELKKNVKNLSTNILKKQEKERHESCAQVS